MRFSFSGSNSTSPSLAKATMPPLAALSVSIDPAGAADIPMF